MRARWVRGLAVPDIGTSATLSGSRFDPTRHGTPVIVELYPARHIDVPMAEGSVQAFDDVVELDGRVDRASGDTLWLRDVGLKSGEDWSWPGERRALAVPEIGRSATVRRGNSGLLELSAMTVGFAFVAFGAAVALWIFLPK